MHKLSEVHSPGVLGINQSMRAGIGKKCALSFTEMGLIPLVEDG